MANPKTMETQFLPMPIPQKAFQVSRQFASQQLDAGKANQIYFNTLAVWAVNDYLQLLEIETDLEQSDSWNFAVRTLADVADLQVRGLGKLECRSVPLVRQSELNGSGLHSRFANDSCAIPPEVWCDRIGYVAVAIDEENREAILLGFSPTAGNGTLSFSELRSLDDLLAHLDRLSQAKVNLSQWFADRFAVGWQAVESLFPSDPLLSAAHNLHEERTPAGDREGPSGFNFGHWFLHLFETGRQAIENLLRSDTPSSRAAFAFRGRSIRSNVLPQADIAGTKAIDLGLQLQNLEVSLLVALSRESDGRINILVQLHPARPADYLPPQIQLALVSELDETLQEVVSRSQDFCIQLKPFKALPETNFSLKVALGEVSITETFIV